MTKAKKETRPDPVFCAEPETLPGLAVRFGIDQQQLRMWKHRTEHGTAVPKAFPPCVYRDSSGKEIWDGVSMDEWWESHPSNVGAAVPA